MCRFHKRVGGVYQLYRRPDGILYWSMLSPAEWDGHRPHTREGSLRLELDLSFSAVPV